MLAPNPGFRNAPTLAGATPSAQTSVTHSDFDPSSIIQAEFHHDQYDQDEFEREDKASATSAWNQPPNGSQQNVSLDSSIPMKDMSQSMSNREFFSVSNPAVHPDAMYNPMYPNQYAKVFHDRRIYHERIEKAWLMVCF